MIYFVLRLSIYTVSVPRRCKAPAKRANISANMVFSHVGSNVVSFGHHFGSSNIVGKGVGCNEGRFETGKNVAGSCWMVIKIIPVAQGVVAHCWLVWPDCPTFIGFTQAL